MKLLGQLLGAWVVEGAKGRALGSELRWQFENEVGMRACALSQACRLTSVFLNLARRVFIKPAGDSGPVSGEGMGGVSQRAGGVSHSILHSTASVLPHCQSLSAVCP